MRDIPAFDGRACHWLMRSALATWAAGCAPAAFAGSTGVALQLDADWVTWIRAQRRAQGLDPPDAAADTQFQAMLQRLHSRSRPEQEAIAGGVVAMESAAGGTCAAPAPSSARVVRAAESACATQAEID
jgi:hypothetical protein